MKNKLLMAVIAGVSVGCMSTKQLPELEQPKNVKAQMIKVGDWMQANRRKVAEKRPYGKHRPDTNWVIGAWYAGQYALYDVTKDPKHLAPLMAMEKRTGWKVGRHKYFADDQATCQTYLDLYMNVKKDTKIIAHTQKVLDEMMAKPVDLPMDNHHKVCFKGEWSWCDSLFMGPPVWAKMTEATGDIKYLDFMDKKWDKTYDFLYDKKEDLYYRDAAYFKKKEKNGKKVFWSRGNGWVMGGLVRVLEAMPEDYPSRPKYEKLLQKMSVKIASLQQTDGFWRASMLDPDSFPGGESSGTGFFCYAMAWGINNGILDYDTYYPVVSKAWAALNSAVHPSGKLGWTQAIGADPRKTTYEATEVYAVGAFLLAGREMIKLAE